jgi:hypothetical protein
MIKKRFITWFDIKNRVQGLYNVYGKEAKVYGVPRGGQYLAPFFNPVDTPEEADFIIDDLVESGLTKNRYKQKYPSKPFEVLFDKTGVSHFKNVWLVFPWEQKEEPLKDNIIRICQAKGWKEFETLEELKIKLNEN